MGYLRITDGAGERRGCPREIRLIRVSWLHRVAARDRVKSMQQETFKVELYNLWDRIHATRGPFNGWGVARYVDGRRTGWVAQFGRDEKTARELAVWLA